MGMATALEAASTEACCSHPVDTIKAKNWGVMSTVMGQNVWGMRLGPNLWW